MVFYPTLPLQYPQTPDNFHVSFPDLHSPQRFSIELGSGDPDHFFSFHAFGAVLWVFILLEDP